MKLKADEFVILAVLSEGEKNSNEIMQGVYRLTSGGLIIRSSGLYAILHGLTNKNLVQLLKKPHEQSGSIGKRTYYRITPLGLRVFQKEVEGKAQGR